MIKTLLVMHDAKHDDYYRMNKTFFESLPCVGQYIYNSDGLAYRVQEVVNLAGYVSSKGVVAILVVQSATKDASVNNLYGLDIEQDLDD